MSPGKVQEAEGGTLLLDEIGELTADAQARLLRFLHDQTYERLGEARERQADVRLIAATNRSLESDVQAGRFREDLFYRLNVVTLTLPALRERPEDILAARAPLSLGLRPQAASTRPDVSPRCGAGDARARLAGESSRVAQRGGTCRHPGVAGTCSSRPISDSRRIDFVDAESQRQAVRVGAPVSLEALEREHIARVVAQSPSLEAAARTLDIDATTLQRKRKRYGLA